MKFNFTVNGDRLRVFGKNEATSGNSNVYECDFVFSEDFNDMVCFAVFSSGEENFTVEIKDNKCIVPYEVLEGTMPIQIGVFATKLDGDEFKRISTNCVGINVDTGAYTIYSVPGTPDIWERYLFDVIKEKELAENAKDTVISVLDEVTEEVTQKITVNVTENVDEKIREEVLAQREEIVEEVLAALPDGDEVSY